MSEQELDQYESQFPLMAAQAFAEARQRVLNSGQSILEAEGSDIYRVFPDGTREVVKQIAPLIPVHMGARYTLK